MTSEKTHLKLMNYRVKMPWYRHDIYGHSIYLSDVSLWELRQSIERRHEGRTVFFTESREFNRSLAIYVERPGK